MKRKRNDEFKGKNDGRFGDGRVGKSLVTSNVDLIKSAVLSFLEGSGELRNVSKVLRFSEMELLESRLTNSEWK